MSLVPHVALYAHGRILHGGAVEAFVQHPGLRSQVPNETLQVYHHLWVWDGHPVACTHVLKVRCEAGVVTCEGLVTE
jgi:hypothetical protein